MQTRPQISNVFITAAVHVLGLLPLFYAFHWTGPAVGAVLYFTVPLLGITMGYHRLLTHRSFRTFPVVRRVLGTLGTFSLFGGPVEWAGLHRVHHSCSDRERDPHSPRESFWWGHILWFLYHSPEDKERYRALARDVARDPYLAFLDRWCLAFFLGHALAVFWGGWLAGTYLFPEIGGGRLGVCWLAWGGLLRVLIVWHLDFMINSVGHRFGDRAFDTDDRSTNNWWLALLTYGEGWHNNHHRYPRSAAHGLRFGQIDFTYATIVVFEKVGLIWDVQRPDRERTVGRHLR